MGEAEVPQEELLREAQNGGAEARGLLLERHRRLIGSVVRRFAATPAEEEDLFQVASMGFLRALDRFDPAHGVRFTTYAVPCMVGEIRSYLRDLGPVKVARSLRELAGRARRIQSELAACSGREPTVTEVADALGVDVAELITALDAGIPPASLDSGSAQEEDRSPLGELLSATGGEGEMVEHLTLREGLRQLDPLERRVLWMRFYEDRTQHQIAEAVGLHQVQVSRLEKRAIGKMRRFFEG